MTKLAFTDLLAKLRLSESGDCLSDQRWEQVVRLARSSGLVARLALYAQRFGSFRPPESVAWTLQSAHSYWLAQQRIVQWELYELEKVCSFLGLPLIVLKGSAYCAADLHAGLGRVFNDIDILLPKSKLGEFKEALKWHGWYQLPLDRYDQHYYEHWMHELPPMRHIKRGTTLDVHHNIVPETCSLCPNAQLLLDAAVNIDGTAYWMLSPEDRLLHSATHLMLGGEFDNGLRDLTDIDLLLRQACDDDADFQRKLLARAAQLGLALPLFYALWACKALLHTPLSDSVLHELQSTAKLGRLRLKLMTAILLAALRPSHPLCDGLGVAVARWLLYLRSHWLKMPPQLLIPHLLRKAWLRLSNSEAH
ncbi:MAG: nucleotidyltransferase family protein [Methylomonas sp.]|nr:nucleotidyltransferase family protein [Methylomonas sp.]PPD19758.1 MAG: hypothetical protein CTY23_10895 [Methylomonas sp.]PPD25581.1 MAG: hypothetical protein CTY22_08045 [Methylomonas sp.]PPD36481.1 MAG: hypothetical protein CTY21_08045 [Methylomonas sp.]PPD40958.1 MAG: hypothetical protein CTY17_04905 [Methylomonas sp.]